MTVNVRRGESTLSAGNINCRRHTASNISRSNLGTSYHAAEKRLLNFQLCMRRTETKGEDEGDDGNAAVFWEGRELLVRQG
jgi:hypothetical protein